MGFGVSSTSPLIPNQTSLVILGTLCKVSPHVAKRGHLNQCQYIARIPLRIDLLSIDFMSYDKFSYTGVYSSWSSIYHVYNEDFWAAASLIG